MKPICIIPARGGSKRLPRKNILPYEGKPLIVHVISAALQSACFDDVIVSSDDEGILAIAAEAGAYPHKRRTELGEDRATVVDVCLEVLESFLANDFCCLYATAALIKKDTIVKSCENYHKNKKNGAKTLMGVSEYEHHPVQAIVKGNDGFFTQLFPEFSGVQSQFFPDVCVSNGTFYWAETNVFRSQKTFYGRALSVYVVPEDEACDIDTVEDYQRLLKHKGG